MRVSYFWTHIFETFDLEKFWYQDFLRVSFFWTHIFETFHVEKFWYQDFLIVSFFWTHIFETFCVDKFWYQDFLSNNWIFATLWVEICRYHDAILCKNKFRGYFIRRIFDFLPFSVLKLHFQHLIFAKI